MDIGKYSFVNRAIQLWNKLPMNALETFPSQLITFRKRVREVISEVNGREFEVRRKSSISRKGGRKVISEVKEI